MKRLDGNTLQVRETGSLKRRHVPAFGPAPSSRSRKHKSALHS
jgi:hypothetical protein